MKQHGIGFLLDLLEVSPTQLALALNVHRTLISKWKSGVRKVDVNNDYFEKLIDYLINRNDNLGVSTLEDFFETIYDSKIDYVNSQDILRTYVKKFIIDNEINERQFKENKKVDGSLYTAPVSIYEGEAGKQKAVLNLLDIADQQRTPGVLTFLYCGVFDIFMEDGKFRTIWLERILKLLDKGFKLQLIYSSYRNAKIVLNFAPLIFHDNCEILCYSSPPTLNNTFSIHALDKKMLIFGLRHHFEVNSCNYCSVFQDSLSIKAYSNIVDKVVSKSIPTFTTMKTSALLTREKKMNYYINIDKLMPTYNTAYYYNSIPTCSFMSDDLFYEILCNSLLSEKQIQVEFKRFKLRKKAFLKTIELCDIVHFYPINNLMKLAEQKTIIYAKENSVICPPLIVSQEQFKRHMHDLADGVLKYPNFNICLNSDNLIPSMPSVYCWCKKNELIFLFDTENPTKHQSCTDVSFVNSIADLFEQHFLYTSNELKSKESVANMLRNL
ncbi:MAG: hypothetical protein RSA29_14880 [Clostridium sp.]|uniref:hypothetical protein n=1 Tax=Clostridium sp. TaxID=1506 RepID=UPI003216FAD9